MPGRVKTRAYDSSRRRAQADATRARIVAAAERLFLAQGYAATTIAAVAAEAGVAVQTVYAVFGNKRTLLERVLAVRVVGDDDDVPLAARPAWRAVEEQQDGPTLLEAFVRLNGEICDRVGPVFAVLQEAARADPALAEVQALADEGRRQDQRRVAVRLHELGALRPDLSVDRAADAVWALADPALRFRLIEQRGWPPSAVDAWLVELLAATLLG